MPRLAVLALLAALSFAACDGGGRTFALMRGSTWRIAPDGTAYAFETRPGGDGIVYRIDGDAVSEALRAPAVEIAIIGLLGDDLVVRTGAHGETLLRIAAHGGSEALASDEGVRDLVPPSCGPLPSDGSATPESGCSLGGVAYYFTAAGELYRRGSTDERVDPARLRDRSGRAGRVVELYPLQDRLWVGTVTSPDDLVQYTVIEAPGAP